MEIHRCRFVPYQTSAINALAFSHTSNPKIATPKALRLAVGRANGDIEIWNPSKGDWFQESILRGGKGRTIEGLVWTQDVEAKSESGNNLPGKLRLFSIGYSSQVTEWDLALGKPLQHSAGNYGEIWCLCAQPKWQNFQDAQNPSTISASESPPPQNQLLAIGCADGTLILLSTEDGELRYMRTLARSSGKKSRILSMTFQNRSVLVLGYADSTMRVFDTASGQQIRSMSFGAGPKNGPSEILVWCIKCLPDGTIVSGDSTGEVRFWDGKSYTLLQRIASHVADVLDIAVSADGEAIVSGGMDRRTTLYRHTVGHRKGGRRSWAEIFHKRLHSHDIKATATFEARNFSVMVSGGLDTVLIVAPLREFGNENHRSLSNLPNLPPLQSAPSKNMIMCWWEREVGIWRVSSSQKWHSQIDETLTSSESEPTLLAKIIIRGDENITSASMTAGGDMLAVATSSEVKLFALLPRRSGTEEGIKVKKMNLPSSVAETGARLIQFSPDSKWLLTTRGDSSIELHRITLDTDSRIIQTVSSETINLTRSGRSMGFRSFQQGALGSYDRLINRAAFSTNSRILSVCDLSGVMDSWVLDGVEDLTEARGEEPASRSSSASSDSDDSSGEENGSKMVLGQRWTRNPLTSLLPQLRSAALVFAFRPSKNVPLALTNGNANDAKNRHHPYSSDSLEADDRLFVLTCKHEIYEFNVLSGKLSDWSRRNPSSSFPKEFRLIKDRVMGVVWDVRADKERAWLFGSEWLWMFDLSRDVLASETKSFPKTKQVNGVAEVLRRKRKREPTLSEDGQKKADNSGAGSKIPDHRLDRGFSRNTLKTVGAEFDQVQHISLEREPSPDSDDDSDHVSQSFLPPMESRTDTGGEVQSNGRSYPPGDTDDIPSTDADLDIASKCSGSNPSHWHTYKYRSILGIVCIGDEDSNTEQFLQAETKDGKNHFGVEVAIVERPIWDLDLPPRYSGDQEWNK